MKISTELLIRELSAQTRAHIERALLLKELSDQALHFKPQPEHWSILECLEHLNRYGDFYLPEVERQLLAARPDDLAADFKSGRLGNYFVTLIKPKAKLNKMNTPAEMNPVHSELSRTTIDRFIKQQKRWLQLLEQAGKVNLTKVKTAVSLSKWIRLRLGDTLRFVIHHNDRHLVQAEKIWEVQRSLAMTA